MSAVHWLMYRAACAAWRPPSPASSCRSRAGRSVGGRAAGRAGRRPASRPGVGGRSRPGRSTLARWCRGAQVERHAPISTVLVGLGMGSCSVGDRVVAASYLFLTANVQCGECRRGRLGEPSGLVSPTCGVVSWRAGRIDLECVAVAVDPAGSLNRSPSRMSVPLVSTKSPIAA